MCKLSFDIKMVILFLLVKPGNIATSFCDKIGDKIVIFIICYLFVKLLENAISENIDTIKTENLYAFDGKDAYSLGQGQ